MSTVQKLMDLIREQRGRGDPTEPMPNIPSRVPSLSSLPQMPPEQLARLAHARANAEKLNRINDEIEFHLNRSLADKMEDVEKEIEARRVQSAGQTQGKTATLQRWYTG
jgi:hypothetical protein